MSFRLKTVLGIAIIESILLLILAVSSLDFLRDSNENALYDRAQTMVRTFAALAKDPVISSDLATLDTFVAEILSEKNVRYIRVRDASGIVLVSGGDMAALQQEFQADHSVSEADDGQFDIAAEIVESGVPFGRIEIGLSTSFIQKIIDEARRWFTFIASIELALTGLFSFILGAYLTRRLSVLRNVTEQIADGDLGVQVPITGRDEIAGTARAFNEMSAKLKQSYQKFVDHQQQTKAIVDNVADAIMTFNDDGRIMFFNAAAQKAFGYTVAEVIGRNVTELIPALADNDIAIFLKSGREKGGSEKGVLRREVEGRRKDGRAISLGLALSCIDCEHFTRFACVVRDISDRLKNDREMRFAQLVYENTTEGIVVTDAEHRILSVNPTYMRMFGYSKKDIVGKKTGPGLLSDRESTAVSSIAKSLKETGRWAGEVTDYRMNGEQFPRWLTLNVVTDKTGKVTNHVAISRDLTEEKRVERMKSEFVSTVSHELRTPLTSIKGSLSLVSTGALGEVPGQAGQLLSVASRNCDRLILLINDILDMEKIASGAMDFVFEPVNAEGFLPDAIASCEGYGAERQISFKIVGEVPSAPFVADKGRLMQVMANLISNAAKFSPECGTVEIRAETSGSEMRISVTDRGPGIPEKFHKQLFEKFTQADSTDGRAKGGTGLGLTITKAIVEKHGGKIDFESTEGVGTTFYFDLPLHESNERLIA